MDNYGNPSHQIRENSRRKRLPRHSGFLLPHGPQVPRRTFPGKRKLQQKNKMKQSVYTIQKPKTIDELVAICKGMKNLDRRESYEYGKTQGISRHNVDAIRQMLGYSNPEAYKHKSAEEREKIVEEYREGQVSMNELARKYGVHYNAIRSLLINRDVMITTSKNWHPRQEKFLIDGLKRKKPIKQIAAEIGKSVKSVQQKIERMKKKGELQ